MITSIAYTLYPVGNIPRARKFYESVLGLKPSQTGRDDWIEYDLGDSTFAITAMNLGHAAGVKGAIVAFEVTDLDGFVQQLKRQGVPFASEIIDTPTWRMAVIEDPDKNHLTIHQRRNG